MLYQWIVVIIVFVFSFLVESFQLLKPQHFSKINMLSASSNVEVYSTSGCKYCRKAKRLLDSFNIKYQSIDITNASTIEVNIRTRERVQFAKSRTVPQIYVKDHHLGEQV